MRKIRNLVLAASMLLTPAALADEVANEVILEAGERTFNVHCTVCHGPGGSGGAGPRLTDQYTLHGQEYEEMLSVITSGVLDVGMPKWSQRLSEQRLRQVAAYVFSLFGTRPRDKPPGENANLTLM